MKLTVYVHVHGHILCMYVCMYMYMYMGHILCMYVCICTCTWTHYVCMYMYTCTYTDGHVTHYDVTPNVSNVNIANSFNPSIANLSLNLNCQNTYMSDGLPADGLLMLCKSTVHTHQLIQL